jgi:hypothetical protein
MPTDALADGLSISHPNFSYYATEKRLPNMSTEMFWWLKGHYDMAQNPSDTYLKRNIFNNTNDSSVRCSYAAARVYRPQLADATKVLTPYGSEIAQKIAEIIMVSAKDPINYHETMPSDKNFINCFVSWRMLGLLTVMHSAIETARARRMQHLEETNSLPPNPPIVPFVPNLYGKQASYDPDVIYSGNNTDSMSGEEETDSSVGSVLGDPMMSIANRMDIYEEKDIIVHSLRYGKFGLATYVPAQALGDSGARTDYRLLVKYSMLDARSIRDGTRGRAKLGLTVSPIGRQLLKDLADKGLIPARAVL